MTLNIWKQHVRRSFQVYICIKTIVCPEIQFIFGWAGKNFPLIHYTFRAIKGVEFPKAGTIWKSQPNQGFMVVP